MTPSTELRVKLSSTLRDEPSGSDSKRVESKLDIPLPVDHNSTRTINSNPKLISMTQAVIKTGGKQYLVDDSSVIRVDKLHVKKGRSLTFSEVLLTYAGTKITIGTPLVVGASVIGKIMRHARYPKVMGVKMKAKKRSKKLFGHKQDFTEVAITKIQVAAGKKP